MAGLTPRSRSALLAAVQRGNSKALRIAPPEVKGDRKFMMEAVLGGDGLAMEFLSGDWQGGRVNTIQVAPQDQGWRSLEYASDELRDDPELMMIAVRQSLGEALMFASDRLRGDRGFIMEAVEQTGFALEFASEELRGDREVVMKAISYDWEALACASDEFRADRSIVTEAVCQEDGWKALEFAAEELRGDPEIIAVTDWGDPPLARVLRVGLLSGRSCTLVAERFSGIEGVLRRCALELGLDVEHVVARGVLLSDTVAISSLHELELGELHELNLLLS